MTIKKKLLLQALLLAIIPTLITAVIITYQANRATFAALEHTTQSQLTSLRELKKAQIESYLHTIEQQVLSMTSSVAVQQSAKAFTESFHQAPITNGSLGDAKSELGNYYQNSFDTTYLAKNPGVNNSSYGKLNALDNKALYFQNRYIAQNQHPLGNKNKLFSAGTEAYDKYHAQYHGMYDDFLTRFGYYDIFIVDAASGHVVYSVFKEIDYATSLRTGPFANSNLAKTFNKVINNPARNIAQLVDFESYYPSYNQAASFIGAPIYGENNAVQAVLIFQMPIDGINSIMVNNQDWEKVGLGASGETYLVGADKKLRSESRFLIEDKKNYIAALIESQSQPNVQQISVNNSALGLQYVNTPGVEQALSGQSGFGTFADYRDVEVLSAYTPIKYGEFNWALMAEIDVEEAFADAVALTNDLYFYMVCCLVIIGVISVSAGLISANRLTNPINVLVHRITEISEGDGDLTVNLSLAKRKDEIGAVGKAFNHFVEQIRAIIAEIDHHATQLASSSEELSAVTNETNTVVIKQKDKTSVTSNVMSELNENVGEIADNSGLTAQLTQQANTESIKGANLSQDAKNAIDSLVTSVDSAAVELNQLNEQVEQITEILTVIDSIADQTNLLALNAAIEAARAGESGRGFSVVADEVRTLAAKTQESTVEIQKHITALKLSSNNSVSAMENASHEARKGITLVEHTANSLQTVSQLVADVSQKNAANAEVAKLQSNSVTNVHQNIIDIAQYTENTSSASLQTSQASNELAKLAVNMSSIVQQFKF